MYRSKGRMVSRGIDTSSIYPPEVNVILQYRIRVEKALLKFSPILRKYPI